MSNSFVYKKPLILLRAISRELRKSMPKSSIRDNESMVYIMDQFRSHDLTDSRVCRARHELAFIADTYLCYLKSTRHYRSLYDKYYSKGERSVAEMANTVGFRLPQTSGAQSGAQSDH